MTFFKLVQKSLVFHWRTNAAVLLGVTVSTAILVGALTIGDSVRFSLLQITFDRLGKTEYVLLTEERFFRAQLGDDLSVFLDTEVAPAILLRGIASSGGGELRANQVQVIGADRRFWWIGSAGTKFFDPGMDEAVVNQGLAARLNVQEGDEFVLRVQKPGMIPGDVLFASGSELTVSLRLRVKAIASEKEFGNFSLKANQAVPLTVFLSHDLLAKKMELENRANLLLVAEKQNKKISLEEANSALKENWGLSDAGLKLHLLTHLGAIELRSNRVFIDTQVADAALGIDASAQGILTYFVNEFRLHNKSTPYSFVSASGEPIVPAYMKDDEIIVNEWLAEDLGAGVGDLIGLFYYVPGPGRILDERSTVLRIRSIVPVGESMSERELMPEFPGLSDVENCRDWDPSIPINIDKIRPKDEEYWNRYRGTPKAFVTLSTAQRLWENRFGNLTAVRYAGDRQDLEHIASRIRENLEPSSLGLMFLSVRQEGIRATTGAVDFGQLFLGLSFFIIAASLILTGLLFAFGINQRAEEIGTLRALGFFSSSILRLFLTEGLLIAVSGSVLGTACGLVYNRVLLYGLGTFWKDAIGTSSLTLHIRISSLLIGGFAGIGISVLAMWVVVQRLGCMLPARVQKSGAELARIRRPWVGLVLAGACGVGIAIVFGTAGSLGEMKSTWSFFEAGTLLLIGSLSLFSTFLFRHGWSKGKGRVSVAGVGFRNFVRRPGRSLAVASILACGIFVVLSVSAHRSDLFTGADRRESGTGGFAYFGETTIPLLYDLNSTGGRKNYGLRDIDHTGVRFVQIRVKEGDDASCLNLNRIETPRILGVRPEELAQRGSFSFVKTLHETGDENPWLLLDGIHGNGVVPAVVDQTVLTWGLHKSIGDTLTYTDERGQRFELKLVASLKSSIFQGNALISEKAFMERFPSVSGYRILLVDAPPEETDQVSTILIRAFRDHGLALVPAGLRLAEFNRVTNTYLSIYLLLGGLGLILGSFGMGLVVLRNVLERRGELAILRAVGFRPRSLKLILLIEHSLMIGAGVVFGVAASAVALLPSLLSPGIDIPIAFIGMLLAAVVVCGWAWMYVATVFATRGNLVPALRNE
jgi:putative ABC transport system permease protein